MYQTILTTTIMTKCLIESNNNFPIDLKISEYIRWIEDLHSKYFPFCYHYYLFIYRMTDYVMQCRKFWIKLSVNKWLQLHYLPLELENESLGWDCGTYYVRLCQKRLSHEWIFDRNNICFVWQIDVWGKYGRKHFKNW